MTNIPAATAESFWAALQESNRFLTEKFAETDRVLSEKFAETDRFLREKFAETDRVLTEKFAETDSKIKALTVQSAETDRVLNEMSAKTDSKINALTEQVTGITKSNGLFAENYFYNSFESGELNLFGEKYDKLLPGSKGKIVNDQYDFILVNGHTSTIIEVKYKARDGDIEKTLKKVETFRKNFPEYHKHKVYLAIAAMSITKNLENLCKKQGIAVIKQVGDKVVVYDENLKAF